MHFSDGMFEIVYTHECASALSGDYTEIVVESQHHLDELM
jgi:hypothetical protein